MEYRLGDRYFYLAPGDLSVARQDVLPTAATFPTGHYHGVTVTVDPRRAPRCLSCFLEDVEVQPAALAEKFCAAGGYFAARSSRRVEHVFSELYQVPEDLRQGYLKVKVLELLLFLSALEVSPVPQAVPGLTRGQVSLARKTADYLLANTESKVTVQELSRQFGASAAQIQASFRGVYGRSPAAWPPSGVSRRTVCSGSGAASCRQDSMVTFSGGPTGRAFPRDGTPRPGPCSRWRR